MYFFLAEKQQQTHIDELPLAMETNGTTYSHKQEKMKSYKINFLQVTVIKYVAAKHGSQRIHSTSSETFQYPLHFLNINEING